LDKIKIGPKIDFGVVEPPEVKDNNSTIENLTPQKSAELN
jgi:hypothetical protein